MYEIIGALAAVLLAAVLKLINDVGQVRGTLHTMTEYWTRTAERRDVLVKEIERLQAAERRRLEQAQHGSRSPGS